MPLKFRLKGLAETFVDNINCPSCGNSGGDDGDQGFATDLTKVTYDGIVVVIRCDCGNIFVPDGQRHGIINSTRLRDAVEKDSVTTGQPILDGMQDVKLEVERQNADHNDDIH